MFLGGTFRAVTFLFDLLEGGEDEKASAQGMLS